MYGGDDCVFCLNKDTQHIQIQTRIICFVQFGSKVKQKNPQIRTYIPVSSANIYQTCEFLLLLLLPRSY